MDFRLPTVTETAIILGILAISLLVIGYSYKFENYLTITGDLEKINQRVSSGSKGVVYDLTLKTEHSSVSLILSKSKKSTEILKSLSKGARIESLTTKDITGREIYFAKSLYANNLKLLAYSFEEEKKLHRPLQLGGWGALTGSLSMFFVAIYRYKKNIT